MLRHLLEHLRRGKVHALWDHLLASTEKAVSIFEADSSPGLLPCFPLIAHEEGHQDYVKAG